LHEQQLITKYRSYIEQLSATSVDKIRKINVSIRTVILKTIPNITRSMKCVLYFVSVV
jgi:hypothetical protein